MIIKRKLNVAVISDVYLGTPNCHPKKLLNYLNSIEPKHLVLNGNIVDGYELKHKYFPKSHLKVIKKIMNLAASGTKVTYIIGNNDQMLRKFADREIGNIAIVNKLLLDLDGKKVWLFNGAIFNYFKQYSKWFTKLGSFGFKILSALSRLDNWYLQKRKKVPNYLATTDKRIKNTFIKTVTDIAINKAHEYVICSNLQQPKIEIVTNTKGTTTYMNTGDWVENFTALEYQLKRWKLYRYNKDKLIPFISDEELKDFDMTDLIAAITIVEQPDVL